MTADKTNSILRFATRLTGLNRAKLDLEYETMNLRAKGLLPNGDGTPPEGVTVDANGFVEGTDLPWADYAAAMGGVGALEATLGADDKAVENALLKFQR